MKQKLKKRRIITGLDLTISPNSPMDPVTVRFTMPDSVIQLKIHDMLGQEIFNKTLYIEKGGHTEIINFEGYNSINRYIYFHLILRKGVNIKQKCENSIFEIIKFT
ncbi:hypothetical protein MASR2M39_10250 [Ignavibacteriales bacterium]